jgi:hypothetical protein
MTWHEGRECIFTGQLRFEEMPAGYYVWLKRHNRWYRRLYRAIRWRLWARRQWERGL